MQHLAHYLARQSGHPEHGDTLATTPLLKKPLSLWERGWGEGLKP